MTKISSKNRELPYFDNITKYHTKQLLKMLKIARKENEGWCSVFDKHNEEIKFYFDEIKNELSKREHIPSKKDARKIRQDKSSNY